jgi:hypothetical protein
MMNKAEQSDLTDGQPLVHRLELRQDLVVQRRRCAKKSRGTLKLRVRHMVERMFQSNKIQCEERQISFGRKKMRVLFYRAKPWQTETAKAKGSTTPFLISLDELSHLSPQALLRSKK